MLVWYKYKALLLNNYTITVNGYTMNAKIKAQLMIMMIIVNFNIKLMACPIKVDSSL